MRKLDTLVVDYPDIYSRTTQDEVSKTYSMPKSYISYRKPRKLSDEQRAQLVQWTSVMRGPKRSGDTDKADDD